MRLFSELSRWGWGGGGGGGGWEGGGWLRGGRSYPFPGGARKKTFLSWLDHGWGFNFTCQSFVGLSSRQEALFLLPSIDFAPPPLPPKLSSLQYLRRNPPIVKQSI